MRIAIIRAIVGAQAAACAPVSTHAAPHPSTIIGTGLPPLPRAGAGAVLTPLQRRLVVAAIVAAHALAAWGLMQLKAVRDAVTEAAPILVSLLATAAPPAPPPPAPPPPTPKAKPHARLKPIPEPRVLATPASPAPDAVAVPPPQEPLAPPVAAPAPVVSVPAPVTAAAEPAAPAPAPKLLPDDAVQYLQAPLVVYPPLSLRRRETGLVVVRAYVGTEGGSARTVQVERSSGHPRLDQAAVAAVQHARFKPYAEGGRPVEGWALVPIRFELEK